MDSRGLILQMVFWSFKWEAALLAIAVSSYGDLVVALMLTWIWIIVLALRDPLAVYRAPSQEEKLTSPWPTTPRLALVLHYCIYLVRVVLSLSNGLACTRATHYRHLRHPVSFASCSFFSFSLCFCNIR